MLPRIRVIQKIYNALMNPNSEIHYNKNQYKKFIKDVVTGTLERSEMIEDTVNKHLIKDKSKKTDKLLKIILFAAVFELLFKQTKKGNYKRVPLASEYF